MLFRSVFDRYAPQIWQGSRILSVALISLVALFVFVRPLMRRAGVKPEAKQANAVEPEPAMLPAGQQVKTVSDLESEIEAQLDAEAAERLEGRRLPVLSRRASHLSTKDPENVAKLLRSWISEA